ncbi:MAG: Asp-tRNA(Asn)/Glu-tRNA(Gln) amidotransferase subunit GatC [Pseudanabaenaceae cyanobacterium]
MDRAQVKHIAHLSRLQLTEAEEVAFTAQLSNILNYFEQLNELNPLLAHIPPTTRAIDEVNITRPDQLQPAPHRELLLGTAPDREGDFFRVPQILTDS